jgi:hypothetical protein
MLPARSERLLLVLACLGFVWACEEDTPVGTTPPPDPTLENLWPNDDGRSWTYSLQPRLWDIPTFTVYDSISQVPPVTLDDVEVLVLSHPIGANTVIDSGIFRLVFDDSLVTPSGARGQNLREELYLSQPSPQPVATSGANAGSWTEVANSQTTFLQRLARARPDLLPRLAAVHPELAARQASGTNTPPRLDEVWLPLLLHGGAFEKTSEHIGNYGVLDLLLAWKFLERNLTPGHEFTHQLVPVLADDVFLHARLRAPRTVQGPAGVFEKALEVLYLVDYGIGTVVDSMGTDVGFTRIFDYGLILYAPTIGPVGGYERSIVGVGDPPNTGIGDTRYELIGTAPLP